MNKKIYVGMMAFGIAASFWACGSGDIIKANDEDRTMRQIMEKDSTFGVVASHLTPEVCPPCFEGSPITSPKVSSSFTVDSNFKNTLFSTWHR